MKQIETTKDDIDQIVKATKVNYPDGLTDGWTSSKHDTLTELHETVIHHIEIREC